MKTKTIQFRLNEDEKYAIEHLADDQNITVSEFIRRCIYFKCGADVIYSFCEDYRRQIRNGVITDMDSFI